MDDQKLQEIEKTYQELEKKITSPDIFKTQDELIEINKEYKKLHNLVKKYREYKKVKEELKSIELLIEQEKDKELKELAEEEFKNLKVKIKIIEKEISKLLITSEKKEDTRNIIIEIRAGTGGEEAALFAYDLFRMYAKYTEKKGYKFEILSSNKTSLGGFKEVIIGVEGEDVFNKFKFESGVHRVQRIPVTESSGRIHTSAATVAVLKEPSQIELKINDDELKIETFRSSGPGGQHANVTSSAVRITHLPTGITVSCQDERSQHQNKERAIRLLRAKLQELRQREQEEQISKERKEQVKSGDRSEKIRTYNFPQDRVTDHRINLTIYNLKDILDGNLDRIIDKLQESYKGTPLDKEIRKPQEV